MTSNVKVQVALATLALRTSVVNRFQVSGVRCQEFNDLGIKGFRN